MIHREYEHKQIGDYVQRRIVAESPTFTTWIAEQRSIARRVFFDELNDPAARESFLADARAKAAVAHPFIAAIYEAGDIDGVCFCAREMTHGNTLREWSLSQTMPGVGVLAQVLTHIAEASIHLEEHNHSTDALRPSHIRLDDHGVIRMENLVINGDRNPRESIRDIATLGAFLPTLIQRTEPGATRMLTLLGWMRGEGIDSPLTWAQVHKYATQIATQLSDAKAATATRRKRTVQSQPRALRASFAMLAAIVLATAAIAVTAMLVGIGKGKASTRQPVADQWIDIPATNEKGPDARLVTLPAFRISPEPITIPQYEQFLKALQLLAESTRADVYDAEDQPETKPDHIPVAWDTQLEAQRVGEIQYVGGIDWWDATAYANWKKCRLPTEQEWFAASSHGLKPATFEWTSSKGTSPANPLGNPLWVIIQGSRMPQGGSFLPREWTDDRSQRRLDLGFRIVATGAGE